MEDVTEYGPSIEDGDPLVVAVGRLGAAAEVVRRPGQLAARLPSGRTGGHVALLRSRFDGDYGNICRMRRVMPDGTGVMTFAPTSEVLAALGSGSPADSLEDLFDKWMAKGNQ